MSVLEHFNLDQVRLQAISDHQTYSHDITVFQHFLIYQDAHDYMIMRAIIMHTREWAAGSSYAFTVQFVGWAEGR